MERFMLKSAHARYGLRYSCSSHLGQQTDVRGMCLVSGQGERGEQSEKGGQGEQREQGEQHVRATKCLRSAAVAGVLASAAATAATAAAATAATVVLWLKILPSHHRAPHSDHAGQALLAKGSKL